MVGIDLHGSLSAAIGRLGEVGAPGPTRDTLAGADSAVPRLSGNIVEEATAHALSN